MTLTVTRPHDMTGVPTEDQTHFVNVMNRAMHWDLPDRDVTVHLAHRTPTGWLEYGIDVKNPDGSRVIFIGAIQRTKGAMSEFHS